MMNRYILSIAMLLFAFIPVKGLSSTEVVFGDFGITYSHTFQHYKDYIGQKVIYMPAKKGSQIWAEDINNFEKKGGVFEDVYAISDIKESRGGIIIYLSPNNTKHKKIKLKVNQPDSFYKISETSSIPLLLIEKFNEYRNTILSTNMFNSTAYGNNVAAISDVFWDYGSNSQIGTHYPQLSYQIHLKYNDSYRICNEIELPSYDELGMLIGMLYEVVDIDNNESGTRYYVLRNTINQSIVKCKKDVISDFSKIGERINCADDTYFSIVDVDTNESGMIRYVLRNSSDSSTVIYGKDYLSDFKKIGEVIHCADNTCYTIVGVKRINNSYLEYTIKHSPSNEISTISSDCFEILSDIGKKITKPYFSYYYTVIGFEDTGGVKFIVQNSVTGEQKRIDSLSECFDGETPITLENLNSTDLRTTRKNLVNIVQSSKSLVDATGWIFDSMFSIKERWVSHKNYIHVDTRPVDTFANAIAYDQNFFTIFRGHLQTSVA